MPSYLQRRHRRWYAIMEIPAALRPRFGKPRFVRSLETESKSVAERRVLPIIAQWRKEIAEARNEPAEDDAAFWNRALRQAATSEERASVLHQIEMAAWDIGAINVENVGDKPSSDPEAGRFVAEATGALVKTAAHLEEWLASAAVKAKTADMRRSTVRKLAVKFPAVDQVTRPEVRRWLNELLVELSTATVQRMTSDCRNYWKYLVTIKVVPEDSAPFDKLGLKVKSSSREPFEPAEVPKLVAEAEARHDHELADLIRMAMNTGARIEELCALKVSDVAGDRFTIQDAKTTAGRRVVPINAALAPVMARLIGDRKDGYALADLSETKYGDRSPAISKRFGRMKTDMGYGDQHVFHSIRKTVVTILERAGVPEGTVQDIVGHERSTLTGSVYSGKSTLAMRREALEKLAYPVEEAAAA